MMTNLRGRGCPLLGLLGQVDGVLVQDVALLLMLVKNEDVLIRSELLAVEVAMFVFREAAIDLLRRMLRAED